MTDIAESLRIAQKAVDDAELREELQVAGFQWALSTLSDTRTNTSGQQTQAPPTSGASEGSILQRIASQLGVDHGAVAEVYEEDGDGGIRLVVPSRSLGKTNAQATQEIAILLTAGRTAAGLGEYTPVHEVRGWCDQYGRLDKGNFARHIAGLDDFMKISGSSPRNRNIALRKPGWERAQELVARLAE